MDKWITFLITLLVGSTLSYSNVDAGQVDFEAGYRRDNISWNNRFPSSDPVFDHSLKFKDLDIFQIGINGRTTVGSNLYVKGNAYWGWILDGNFRDRVSINVDGNNGYYGYGGSGFGSGLAWTGSSRNLIDDKYVYGVGAAIGYPFFFCDCSAVIAPTLGYAFDEQNIRVDDRGLNLCQSGYYDEGGCCKQTFVSRWYGPYVGVDFNYRPMNECWNLYAEVEYHWGSFRGRSSENQLILDNNRQRARNAYAWVFALGANYDLSECWTVGFSLKFQDWTASKNHRECNIPRCDDSSVVTEASNERCGCNRSRNANKWHSYAINLTVGHHF